MKYNYIHVGWFVDLLTSLSMEFLFVSRCGLHFSDGIQWVYWCSCDSARGNLLNSCSTSVDSTYDAFTSIVGSECIHIEPTRLIIQETDNIHNITSAQELSGTCLLKVHAQLIFMNYPHTHSDHSYTLNIEPHKEDTSYSINVGTEVSWTLLCMHVRLQSQLYNYNDLQVVCSIGQAVCTRADIVAMVLYKFVLMINN